MRSIIVPLVKAKGGNMQHISNYRTIALSNASSTIFELAFKPYLENEDPCDMYYFGFAPQLSTGVYAQLHLNAVLNATPNIAAISLHAF
jgi:hypothetical protein